MLFNALKTARIGLPNRIAMCAMATNLADSNGGVTEAMIGYYARRAKGGAGLIIVENSGIAPQGRNGAVQLRCDILSNVPGLGRIASAIHYFGAKTIIQLQHAGQATKKEYIGELPMGPSPVYDEKGMLTARALSVEEIHELTELFVQASVNAELAGFDGVEIHAAHAYLLAEFISPVANHRSDAYGGSIENRARFAKEVVESVRKRVKPSFCIGVRINGMELDEGGLQIKEACQVAQILEEAGADLINVSTGFKRHGENLCSFTPEGWRVDYAAAIKKAVSIPVLCSGGIRSRSMMEEILASGQADIIGVGRQFIADPDWPNKMRNGCEESIARCLMCNVGCAGNRIYGKRSIECVINPDVGRENSPLFLPVKAETPKRIAVIGAGPAGLYFAQEASQRGHIVHLWEKRDRVNGTMYLAASVPGKSNMMAFCRHLDWASKNSTYSLELNSEATLEKILAFRPDAVVYCGGAQPNTLGRVMDYASGRVLTAHELLENQLNVHKDKDVIVVGGGSVGCEVADLLSSQGNRVTIIEMASLICGGTQEINRREILRRLKEEKVVILPNTRLEIMEGDSVVVSDSQGSRSLKADLFVVAAGSRGGEPAWFEQLRECQIPCFALGDGAAVDAPDIMHAIHKAVALGRNI